MTDYKDFIQAYAILVAAGMSEKQAVDSLLAEIKKRAERSVAMENQKKEPEVITEKVEKGVYYKRHIAYGGWITYKLREMSPEAIARYGLEKYVGDGG